MRSKQVKKLPEGGLEGFLVARVGVGLPAQVFSISNASDHLLADLKLWEQFSLSVTNRPEADIQKTRIFKYKFLIKAIQQYDLVINQLDTARTFLYKLLLNI
jgi:hypothetical protein